MNGVRNQLHRRIKQCNISTCSNRERARRTTFRYDHFQVFLLANPAFIISIYTFLLFAMQMLRKKREINRRKSKTHKIETQRKEKNTPLNSFFHASYILPSHSIPFHPIPAKINRRYPPTPSGFSTKLRNIK